MGRYDTDTEDAVEEEEVKPRRSRYEEDDETTEEAPRSRRRSTVEDDDDEVDYRSIDRKSMAGGWGNAEKVKTADSPFAQNLKVTEVEQVVKFLEDEPYASYRQHWINERQGQKSFTCLSDLHDEGCPLCDAGHRPSSRFSFNVAVLSGKEDPLLRSYDCGPRVIDQLKNLHQSTKTGPLTKHYWAISRTGKKGSTQTNHQVVKERDLDEEWGIAPLDEGDIAKLKKQKYTADIVFVPSRKTLADIAAEELGED